MVEIFRQTSTYEAVVVFAKHAFLVVRFLQYSADIISDMLMTIKCQLLIVIRQTSQFLKEEKLKRKVKVGMKF